MSQTQMHLVQKPWKPFPIDVPSLLVAIKAAVPTFVAANAGFNLQLSFSAPLTHEQKEAIDDIFDDLNQQTEAAKRALPSRKTGQAMIDFLNLKKSQAAVLTWDQMSVAQRKLVMGSSLTASELDTL